MSNQSLISIRDISKTYVTRSGRVNALQNVSLDVGRGEFVALLGPSGCGKSTLMMIIAGLLNATAGEVHIGDTLVTKPYTDVGIVFQNHVLLEWRTVMQNIMFQIEMRRLPAEQYKARAHELIESVSLTGFEDKYPHELSGGMRQRVAICRALVHDPPILLMDEPFGALDALTREQLCIDLEKIWLRSGKTVLFITHSIREAVQLADRVCVMTPRPGVIQKTIDIKLERPRYAGAMATERFGQLTDEIRAIFMAQGVLRL